MNTLRSELASEVLCYVRELRVERDASSMKDHRLRVLTESAERKLPRSQGRKLGTTYEVLYGLSVTLRSKNGHRTHP